MAGKPHTLAQRYFNDLSLFEDEIYLPPSQPSKPIEPRVLSGAMEPLPESLDVLNQNICQCTKCSLGHTRTKFVFGDGNPNARIVLIGEAPGHDEDLQGIPFVGRAGQLLNQLLAGVGLSRTDVYICNVLKCRPPGNRDPEPAEAETCSPYLLTQLSLINPDILVCLGRHAVSLLLGLQSPMKDLRGRTLPWKRYAGAGDLPSRIFFFAITHRSFLVNRISSFCARCMTD